MEDGRELGKLLTLSVSLSGMWECLYLLIHRHFPVPPVVVSCVRTNLTTITLYFHKKLVTFSECPIVRGSKVLL